MHSRKLPKAPTSIKGVSLEKNTLSTRALSAPIINLHLSPVHKVCSILAMTVREELASTVPVPVMGSDQFTCCPIQLPIVHSPVKFYFKMETLSPRQNF